MLDTDRYTSFGACPLAEWLGTPGTSAGVERLFSKAGKMHHDLKGSMEAGSLEHSLEHSLITCAN